MNRTHARRPSHPPAAWPRVVWTVAAFKSSLARLRRSIRADDHGYSTETVLVIALLVLGAITAVGLITSKVIDVAENLQLG